MSESTTIPTFEVHLPEASQEKFENERRAFYRLLPDLLETHFGQYVAIHEQQVIDSGPKRLEVALRVWQRVGNVPIYVALVSEQRQPIERSRIIRDLSQRRSGA